MNLKEFKNTKLDDGRLIGIYLDMPDSLYHSIEAFSFSGAKVFKRSAMHYKHSKQEKRKLDPDNEIYRAVHLLCLESERQEKIKVFNGTWRDALKKEVEENIALGFICLKEEGLEKAKAIAKAIKSHKEASFLLDTPYSEVSIFWVCKNSGAYCKARIDSLVYLPISNTFMIGDIKNFGSIEKEFDIGRQIHEEFYYWQMSHYSSGIKTLTGLDVSSCRWIFVEEKPPHGVKVRSCPEALLNKAKEELKALRVRYANCVEFDIWPGYEEAVKDSSIPDYVKL